MNNNENRGAIENLGRREVLLGAAAVATTLAAAPVFAAEGHDHTAHNHHMNANEGVIDAAQGCVKSGQACLDHCIELVKVGDTSIAGCLDSVTEMLAMCGALAQMASYQSKHLSMLANVCMAVCRDCEKACKQHADEHAACKACMESCRHCINACEKIAA